MRTRALALLAIAALGLAVGGCDGDTSTTTPSTPGGTGTAAAPPGDVAECVVGDWRSTGANAQARSGGATATLTGGAGVAVKITKAGAVTIDFSNMQPADFTVQVAGAQVRGKFTYSGHATGTIRTGEAATSPTATDTAAPTTMPATPSSAGPTTGATTGATAGPTGEVTSGTWEPVPPIDWGDVRVTVDLTEPVQARPFDNVRIGEVLGGGVDQTGDIVDVNPLFGRGGYECSGDQLVITPEEEAGLGWDLARA